MKFGSSLSIISKTLQKNPKKQKSRICLINMKFGSSIISKILQKIRKDGFNGEIERA